MTEFLNTEPAPQGVSELIEDRGLFTDALSCQDELDTLEFDSYRNALRAASEYVAELDIIAHRSDAMYQEVTIHGENIVVPQPTIDITTGAMSINSVRMIRSEDNPFTEPSLRGDFYGFSAYAAPLNDDGSRFRAVIGYRVSVGGYFEVPNFCGTLTAYSAVDSSTLEFTQDRTYKNITEAMEILTTIEDASTASVVSTVDKLLCAENRFEQSHLRKVARLIRRHMTKSDQPIDGHHKDALLDLVKARLGLYDNQPFAVDAESSIESTALHKYGLVTEDIDIHTYIKDVTFAPYYWEEDGNYVVETTHSALSIIVEHQVEGEESSLLSIPFERIRSLQPISR